jgi:hypothetical protein
MSLLKRTVTVQRKIESAYILSRSAVLVPENPAELAVPNNTHVSESEFSSEAKYDALHSQGGLCEMTFSLKN